MVRMDKALRGLALLGNVVFLVVVVWLWGRTSLFEAETVLSLILMTVLPLLNLWIIWHGPDREERQLRRAVTKAELRKRLRDAEKT